MFMVLFLVSCTFGAQKEVPNTELPNYKIEQLQKTIDELKKDVGDARKSEQGIESLKDRLGDANSRIDNISGSVDRFGIVITILLVSFSLATYFSVQSKSKEEARESAKKETEEWINKEAQKTLQTIINKLEEEAQKQIKNSVQTAKGEIKKQSNVGELFMLSKSYFLAKNYDKAIDVYQKIIEINPNSDIAYINLGLSYRELGNVKEAIKSYQRAIAINPKSADAYFHLGVVYSKQGKIEEATEAYQKAIVSNPKNDQMFTNLFELQLIQNYPFSDEKSFLKLFLDNKIAMMIYEMLKVIQAILLNSVYPLSKEEWKQKYQGIKPDWGWDEMDSWLSRMEESKTKVRLMEAVAFFKEALKG